MTARPPSRKGPRRRALAVLLLTLTAVTALAQEPARRPRVGLALGGGSARGLAHTGVVTGGLAADTIFGPFFVGGSVGRGGNVRAHFLLGPALR